MRLVLLGDPVEHSRSPAIHNSGMAACGLGGHYEARTVDEQGFDAALLEIRQGVLSGANVTMPHKRRAHDRCDVLSEDARDSGAVNTLAMRDGGLTGWNTDVTALRRLLGGFGPGPLLILGVGGAAAAAAIAGADRTRFVSARARRRVDDFAGRFEASSHPWGVPLDGAIVINATPLGMRGEALPEGVLDGAVGLIDLPYGSAPTPAVETAAQMGIPHEDGLSVLVEQAADGFEIWTGLLAPKNVMFSAVR